MSRLDIIALAIAANAQGGGEASGEIDINANGTYNVAGYATANVNVPPVLARGVPIEVSELPTPTAEDVGKVYLNTTNDEYYVGEEQVQEFVVGEPLGDKIYFDTTKNPMDYISNLQDGVLILLGASNGVEDILLYFADLAALTGSNVHLYFLMFGNANTNETTITYVYSDDISVEDYNTSIAPNIGLTISQYGWQKNVIDTSLYSNIEITQNNLSLVDNLAYKSKTITFKPLDEPPLLQEKTVTENGVVVADSGYDGLSKVTVDVADKGTATLNALIDGSLTEIESGAESVRNYAFYYFDTLQSVSFPNATSIGNQAFYRCKALKTVNFPNITSIGESVFNGCEKLTIADFPNATSIEATTFQSCYALTTANFPNATSVGSNAFSSCYALTTANFPNATSVGSGAFGSCSALTTADFPNATSVGTYAFQSCYALTTANFPNATSIGQNAFQYCYILTTAIIGTNQTSVATLSKTNAFSSCHHILGSTNTTYNPTGAKDGYIYVPLALVADYRVATNWSTYASQIMPYVATVEELANIDGTTYDKAYVGENSTEYTYNGTTWEVYTR